MQTLTDLKRRVASTQRWLKVLEDGLEGKPHSLGAGEADAFEKSLARLEIQFLSVSKATKEGLELKRGASPVVNRYYGAPISKHVDLYVLEQFRTVGKDSSS